MFQPLNQYLDGTRLLSVEEVYGRDPDFTEVPSPEGFMLGFKFQLMHMI